MTSVSWKTNLSAETREFQRRLLEWYGQSARDLPWRATTDPYPVLVSEVMCQQTTIAAVVPFFIRWMERFPTVHDLARASEGDVAIAWAGLGYYSRCRRLHAAARAVDNTGWPVNKETLLTLPGVGDYTASAVASICFGEPVASVDVNVERVYARVNADSLPKGRLRPRARAWAQAVIGIARHGDSNQALMELGALVCRPKAPTCHQCPVRSFCAAYKAGTPERFPSPDPRRAMTRIDHSIWIPYYKEYVGVVRTPAGEWWAGLWGFPRGTTVEAPEFVKSAARVVDLGSFSHTVTRYQVSVQVLLVECLERPAGFEWARPEDVGTQFALPAPQVRALGLLVGKFLSVGGQPSFLESEDDQAVDEQQGQAVEAGRDDICKDQQAIAAREPLLASKTGPGSFAPGAGGIELD